MKTTVLGYPRIGEQRALKKAIESYWKGDVDKNELLSVCSEIKKKNWLNQNQAGIDLIPSNDFSLYDHVLDMSIMLGCIPERFVEDQLEDLELYFAMARGVQKDGLDITALELTKWFDTNYHYLVPEFKTNTTFKLNAKKIIEDYKEALALGIKTKPVIIGPVTYLLLGKEKETNFNRLELIDDLIPVYIELLTKLDALGVDYIQIDEPILATDLSENQKIAIVKTYQKFNECQFNFKIILANYFDCFGDNLDLALSLPADVLHLDLVRCPLQLDDILNHDKLNPKTILSLGLVDGRNVWKNDFLSALIFVDKAFNKLGKERVWIASSCSLLHAPYDLDLETNEKTLPNAVKQWLAFSKQKLKEIATLRDLSLKQLNDETNIVFEENKKAIQNKKSSGLIHNRLVSERIANLKDSDSHRSSIFLDRQKTQKEKLKLPLFPTTTIGSFPQTKTVRSWRSKLKKGLLTQTEYDKLVGEETKAVIKFQDDVGLDVLVHGEFERNDMVEYFGELLEGFAFTNFGWVQSYGTRCVKPPIIFGDVYRPKPMTVKWSLFAQSLSQKFVKGMLTGPVTILQWSFVRNDQPRSTTCNQIALAIRDEVLDLENAGIKIIQIDEPAIREGLPLRQAEWKHYLDWAVKAFRISSSGVKDETQIHTHMCYSEFNDIISSIADMDADVITIETSRSEMELLNAFVDFKYPNEIGPGVYDIHSPRIPTEAEIESLLIKASKLLPVKNIWVNPDCGLKTRDWPETKIALERLVNSAKKMREEVSVLH